MVALTESQKSWIWGLLTPLVEFLPNMHEALGIMPCVNPGTVARAYNRSTWQVAETVSNVRSHQLQSKCEASLSYTRPCLQKAKQRNKISATCEKHTAFPCPLLTAKHSHRLPSSICIFFWSFGEVSCQNKTSQTGSLRQSLLHDHSTMVRIETLSPVH